MSYKYLGIFILLFSSSVFSAADKGHGKVTMTGEIIEAACTIATDDVWQEIDFGVIPLNEFAENNAPLEKKLTIHLVNCSLDKKDGGTWNTANITFDGPSYDGKSDMFAMTGDGKGVGVNIIDEVGNKAIVGQALPNVSLHKDDTNLNFNIHLTRSDDELTAGNLSSFVRFMVTYQ